MRGQVTSFVRVTNYGFIRRDGAAAPDIFFHGRHARYSGPVELMMWSCDARDAATHDTRAVAEGRQHRRRYYRYDPRAPRLGLPVGVEPGRSHQEQVERQTAADQALEVAKSQDPEFGSDR